MSVIDEVFNSGKYLPVLPKVVHEVMQALDEASPNLGQVAEKINHDPVIAAKVLKLANSAQYGVQRKIKTIEEAIALIGFSKIATLVIASAITSAISDVPNINMRLFWMQSLVSASVARALTIELNQSEKHLYSVEQVYLAGLLHGIGQLIVHLFFPIAGARIEKDCQEVAIFARKNIENEQLGIDHCQIGQELARRWDLPVEIQQVIRYYAEPNHLEAGHLAPIVHQAVLIADGLIKEQSTEYISNLLLERATMLFTLDQAILKSKIKSYVAFLPEAEALI